MTTEEIKSYLSETKGKEIQIFLSDGRKFVVKHTDYLMFHPVGDGMFLFFANSSYIVLNRHHITSLES